jgi:hypothetical protein
MPYGSSKFKGSTFNDHTPSDSSSVSGILELRNELCSVKASAVGGMREEKGHNASLFAL